VLFVRPRNAGLQQYLGALHRVSRALADLNATNIRSNQQAVSEFSSLLSSGNSKLQDHYRSVLRENVNTVEPLHYLTKRKRETSPMFKLMILTS
jgi:exocyst complex protein 7